MKSKIARYIDIVILTGWTVVGLLNLIFFIVHVSPVNFIGMFSGRASLSFTFMAASALIMVPVSAIIVYLAFRRKPVLDRLRNSTPWRLTRVVMSIFAAFFIVVELNLIIASFPKATPATPEIIILGAHVEQDGLSETLYSRLITGLEYAKINPDVRIVVSGGQGLDEPVSEAVAMRDFLVLHGLDESRILMEDKSYNTFENLMNSYEILQTGNEQRPYPITIVTSEFHIFRSAMLAKRVGFEPYFAPAATPRSILLSCYSREFFGLLKSYFMDR
ncbi:MAG: YdcF family protein [Oscillospiraceae bacterium]|nr:YdcF family protein [Oscillospiraceae bacterium]